MADNVDKTQSDAVSDVEVDKTPQPATESVTNTTPIANYSKQALIESDQFNFLDRNIIELVIADSSMVTVEEAKDAINKFKGVED